MYSRSLPAQLAVFPQRQGFSLSVAIAHLLMLAFMIGLGFVDVWQPVSEINRAVGIVLIAVYVLFHFHRQLRIAPELLFFGLFILWAGVGMPAATEASLAWSYWRQLVQTWGLVFAVAGIAMTQKKATFNFFILIVCALFLACYGHISGDYKLAADVEESARASSLLANPNTLGFVMIYGTMGLAYFWGTRKGRYFRVLTPFLAVFLWVTLVATGSRKSYVALLAFLLAWMFFCYRRYIFQRFRAILMIASVLAGIFLLTNYMLYGTYLGERFRESIEARGLDVARTGMYQRGFELFADNPIAGVGLGNFAVLSGFGTYSHSDYMEVLSTTGFVGFVLYFSVYAFLYLRVHRVAKRTADPEVKYRMGIFKAIIITLLALGFGMPSFLSIYTWFILAGLIGTSRGLAHEQAEILRYRNPRIVRRVRHQHP